MSSTERNKVKSFGDPSIDHKEKADRFLVVGALKGLRFHTQPRKKMKVSILIRSVTSVTSKKSLKKGEPLELNCLVSKLWFHLNICVNYQIFQLFLCKFSNSSCYWCHQCHQKNGDERNYAPILFTFLKSSVSPMSPAKWR